MEVVTSRCGQRLAGELCGQWHGLVLIRPREMGSAACRVTGTARGRRDTNNKRLYHARKHLFTLWKFWLWNISLDVFWIHKQNTRLLIITYTMYMCTYVTFWATKKKVYVHVRVCVRDATIQLAHSSIHTSRDKERRAYCRYPAFLARFASRW